VLRIGRKEGRKGWSPPPPHTDVVDIYSYGGGQKGFVRPMPLFYNQKWDIFKTNNSIYNKNT